MIYIPKLKFGNLRTLEAFLKTLEFDFCSIKIEDLEKIDQGTLLIPGNGNWSSYIESGIINLIKTKKYMNFIGICGGFQIFFQNSEEAPGNGSALMSGNVQKLSSVTPTIGYLDVGEYGPMYFSNSYGVPFKKDKTKNIELYEYDGKKYIACFRFKNLIGFQFHPEVSGNLGREIFLKYTNHLNLF
jgi:imidazoleglycerol phosphate synthase glutamine amidotransferase subunit HisH